MPETKTLRTSFDIKAVIPEQRIIEGFAAVGGNLDRVRDVIDHGANLKAAQTPVGDVGVFIGHQSADLPVGRCLELRAVGDGLYSKTYIFPTSRGDDLLLTAKALQEAGSALGMSIGYRTDDYTYEQREGKTARVIKSYQLAEYSFAARQVIANPRALVTGVKTDPDTKAAVGSFDWTRQQVAGALMDSSGLPTDIVELYPDRVVYRQYDSGKERLYRCSYSVSGGEVTLGDPTPVDVQYVDLPAEKTAPGGGEPAPEPIAVKAVWSTRFVNDLPDSSFLHIESGGVKDDEGKTTPRSLRHFPYKDAEGKVDLPHLRNAIARIPQASGLDDALKQRLQARARRLLDGVQSGKTAAELETPEWAEGAALAIRGIAYRLLDASDTVAGELKAMSLLGSDTKRNGRLRPEVRATIADLHDELGRVVRHAELIDEEQDGVARDALLRSQLALLEV